MAALAARCALRPSLDDGDCHRPSPSIPKIRECAPCSHAFLLPARKFARGKRGKFWASAPVLPRSCSFGLLAVCCCCCWCWRCRPDETVVSKDTHPFGFISGRASPWRRRLRAGPGQPSPSDSAALIYRQTPSAARPARLARPARFERDCTRDPVSSRRPPRANVLVGVAAFVAGRRVPRSGMQGAVLVRLEKGRPVAGFEPGTSLCRRGAPVQVCQAQPSARATEALPWRGTRKPAPPLCV